jgi:excinuclease UvrABC ATPase subunit
MQADNIEIAGARENNLKDVTVRIPKRQLVVFTGVSGSGKSSLVFDTIAAEAQRQLNETFTTFARARMPSYGQPDVDTIENLSAAIIVNQKRLGGGSRSTVGTITDIYSFLRLLYSRIGAPPAGFSNAYSFNDPQGMCPECDGLGTRIELDLGKFLDTSKSLNDGAIQHPDWAVGKWYWNLYAQSGLFDLDKPIDQYSDTERGHLLDGAPGVKITWNLPGGDINSRYEGIVERFKRLYIAKDVGEMSERNREVFLRFVTRATCELCHGARLSQEALASRINGRNIAELAAMEATELVEALKAIDDPVAAPIVATLLDRVGNLVTIGLGYVSLNRVTDTLSGGESQRIKMVRHLGSSLTEMLYVFDEPSIGLHARDVARMNQLLVKLRDKGNTVLVVEHDRDVIEIADHVVDLGPGAGRDGGEVVFEGTVEELVGADTLTGRFMRHELPLKTTPRTPTGSLLVRHVTMHNLRDVSVGFPTGVLTVVTGVAGSGKSTLVHEGLVVQHPDAIVIDQTAVTTNRRSSPSTYTGIMDDIRKLFAKANGVSPSLFSFNSTGACPNCQGLGVVYTDLAYMDGLKSLCEVCQGRRFQAEVLAHTLRGHSISDVLEMPAERALGVFDQKGERRVQKVLRTLVDVGLGYLTLGQPLSTLSGGECQRLKLATELHRTSAVYVMDEPTTGLHMSDIGHLLGIIERLVETGGSVVVIEHNLDVIKNADWVIDLGPEGGSGGGQVLFEGTPEQLLESETSLTAEHLRRHVGAAV